MTGPDLLRLSITGHSVILEVSLWFLATVLILLLVLRFFVWNRKSLFHKYELVKLNVQLGNVGSVELRPNNEDVQIAHRIWTELVTRKAAQPLDIEHDVIVEIYDSWYALFRRVRELISDIPSALLRKEKSTQELVRIATQTLNNGLRPHLTRWQARFRHWYANCPDALKEKCPQDCQKHFPEYGLLIEDIKRVNTQLIQYAGELEKIIHGSSEK
jgi:hypothetical protein